MSATKNAANSPSGERRSDAARPQDSDTKHSHDQGIVRDSRGEQQPKDKGRAQQSSGEEAQREAARQQPPGPGQPAGGE